MTDENGMVKMTQAMQVQVIMAHFQY